MKFVKYCAWLTKNAPAHTYRLPTEGEWEFAAGHMPKDADFNCGVGDTLQPVDAYAQTKGACGGIDFWGNCWEWTSTARGKGKNAVKGGVKQFHIFVEGGSEFYVDDVTLYGALF